MSAFFVGLEGTEAGRVAALCLAVLAALLHATFAALQKGRHDPWLTRGSIDVSLILVSLPLALLVVPLPQGREWWLIAGTIPIHFVYKLGMAMALSRGAFTVVYPVVRGTAPLATILGAAMVFGEVFTPVQWLGVAVLLGGIFGLAIYNLRHVVLERDTLVAALTLAVATGLMVAVYTNYDAYGIRATPDPFTFLIWFFLVTAFDFPVIAALRYRNMANRPALGPLLVRGAIGAVFAYGSFGAIMLATRLDKVGEAAMLRETSTVFAALIGWLVLKETVGPRRFALMTMIAVGAIIIELGA